MDPMGLDDGGFMAGAAGESGAGDSGKKKQFQDRSYICTTVKQLTDTAQNFTGGDFKVDGVLCEYIKLCGTIESIESHTTSINYFINDTTGSIRCFVYLNKEDDSSKKYQDCLVGDVVRLVGQFRAGNGSDGASINTYKITKVTDFNEVTNHILETIFCHCYATKGPIPGSAGAASKNYNMGMGSFGAARSQGAFTPGAPAYGGGGSGVKVEALGGGDVSTRDAVIEAIRKTSSGDSGTTTHEVHNYLTRFGGLPSISINEVTKIVQGMTDEGLVYSTIDESHFTCTD
jgi:replication factor A2